MKIKYIVLIGDSVVVIYENPRFGLVVVFRSTQIDIEGKIEIRDHEKNIDIEGAEFEEIKQILIDALPIFHETS